MITTQEPIEAPQPIKYSLFTADQVAQVAYEAMAAYDLVTKSGKRPHWEELSDEQKNMYIEHAKFSMRHRNEFNPMDQHNDWVKRKEEEGWTYGAEYSLVDRRHPHLLPFQRLPKVVRIKRWLFDAIVANMT